MEFTLTVGALAKELSLAASVCSKKSTHEILTHVLIEAKDDMVTLSTTDLALTFRSQVDASVACPGSVAIAAKRLYAAISELPEETPITISALDNKHAKLTAKDPKVSLRFTGLDPEMFPTLPNADGPSCVLSLASLKAALSLATFALDAPGKPSDLAQIKRAGDGLVSVCATNRARIALVHVASEVSEDFGEILLPRSMLDEIGRLDEFHAATVTITRGASHVGFSCGPRLLLCKGYERRFVDYEKIVAGSAEGVTLDSAKLSRSLALARLFAGEGGRGAPDSITITLDAGLVTVATASESAGEGSSNFECAYAGEPVELRIDAGYVIDFLGAIKSESVSFAPVPNAVRLVPVSLPESIKSYLYVVALMKA